MLLAMVLFAGLPLSVPNWVGTAAAQIDAGTRPPIDYPVPPGATFVAPGGDDGNPGTSSAPMATVAGAIDRVVSGSTIVLRAGTYREALGTVAKRITIQPYTGETVSLKGSVPVDNWIQEGPVWRKDGWTKRFCQSCVDPAVIDPAYPLAGSPDMAFLDGLPLTQVSSQGALGPGSFFVDYANSRLYIGSSPSGRLVEAAVRGRAALFNGASSGSVVRGLSFLHYAPTYAQELGAIVADAPNLTFENNTIAWSATRGLSINERGAIVRDNSIVNNGAEGLHGHEAHGVSIERNDISLNNQEHFVDAGEATAAAGAKFTSSHDLVMRNNRAQNNRGNGLWCDISCHNATIVGNFARGNTKNGLSFEISAKAIIASNVSVENGATGLKIAGSNRVRVYNNTLANNYRQIGIYEDTRVNTNPADHALGITWETNNIEIKNNIFSTTGSGGEVVHTHDTTVPDVTSASQMISGMNFNAYYRASSAAPARLIRWCRQNLDALNFTSLDGFRSATGREFDGIESTNLSSNPFFVDEARGNYSLKPGSAALGTGEPLPPEVASAIGVASGGAVNRGALVWSGMTSVPTTTVPTTTVPTTTVPTTVVPTTVPTTTVPSTSPQVAVYRLRDPYSGNEFYTSSTTERDRAVSSYGYTYERIAFHGLPRTDADAVPVYRLVKGSDHFYTVNPAERDRAVSYDGYAYEMVAFYASASARAELVAVYRFLNKATGSHAYFTGQTELGAAYSSTDLSYEMVAFYVLP